MSMEFFKQFQLETDADDLGEDIVKQFSKFNVNISITNRILVRDNIIFCIKPKGNTREAHIRANAPDVQLKLKLPLFYVVKNNFTLYLIVSRKRVIYKHLPFALYNPSYQKNWERIQLPYLIGYDVLGRLVVNDLVKFPHLLLGGSTSSGKSVGLQALIVSIAHSKPPSQVNFILIDVGATDLMFFEKLPHLSCPVVRDRTTAIHTLTALTTEMERRIELEYTDSSCFRQLPRLVVVIDEFPALFMGVDKSASKTLIDNVSNLLQRGRHAKMHLVLAAQNPTIQNMKVDLGNITARIAFKCAKKNFSETILGEGGAENLMGAGDLLIRSPQFDAPQRVQGIYITPSELQQTIQYIVERYPNAVSNKFDLILPGNNLTGTSSNLSSQLSCIVVRQWPSDADQLLASVILWAFEHEYVSTNMLVNEYRLGWNKASNLIAKLEELGIVDKLEGKSRRKVIPSCPEDVPEELKQFLKDAGRSSDSLCSAFYHD